MSPRKLPFSKAEFKEIYSKVPRLTVDLIIKTEQGILMLKRSHKSWKDMWHLPGGTVMIREKAEDAVKRIALEELELKIKPIKFLGYMEFMSELEARGFGYSVSLAFLCEPMGEIPDKSIYREEVKFFKKADPNSIPEHKEFLTKFFDN